MRFDIMAVVMAGILCLVGWLGVNGFFRKK